MTPHTRIFLEALGLIGMFIMLLAWAWVLS